MTRSEKIRCWVYALIALAALVGTQWVLADYLGGSGTLKEFLDATVDGNAATFVSIDLLAVAFAAVIFMIADGRQLGVRWLWAYVALVFLVAVSVAFPLYLIARTRTVAIARAGT
ncbi:DUF2834 domain-containing protein [Nocardioides marmoriginsengisoli]|uniref:DUF2834 domain-containing protein n=1 Tax=Nocardioides marmoriginsengisoli TaxID=661483 RepID=A0A3N0CLG2_9ACTN|nr:DUF2834 domain-containing protein [Nocardioides marmoriginsengisoli]RNL63753.1 DUF2834 domain-containing protein [Nocardioides marmoriginsengisoli]